MKNILRDEFIAKAASLFSAANLIPIESHEGGRNIAYRCVSGNADAVLRITYLPDRTYEDILAEAEFSVYLKSGGASVASAIPSVNGRLAEMLDGNIVCLFELAKGDQLAEHGYAYRDGVPLSEYFFNMGKTLGKIHALSKAYKPVHPRYDFFDFYNDNYLSEMIPDEYSALRDKIIEHIAALKALREDFCYGMVHYDYSDGNYMIDYSNGDINVFDFDNCMTCFYMFDLANVWSHGVGWIAYESDIEKRRAFMNDFFAEVVRGYRTETDISDTELEKLPLFVKTVLIENIVDEFQCMKYAGDADIDEEQLDKIECYMNDIPFMGFFEEEGSDC